MAQDKIAQDTLRALRRPRRLTLAGLWVERLAEALWPVFTLALVFYALVAFGAASSAVKWMFGAAFVALTLWRIKDFRIPHARDALLRMDEPLQGHPIAALQDAQALGREEAASQALWQAHIARMAQRAQGARAHPPRPRITQSDRYGLRLMALTAASMALLFGEGPRQISAEPTAQMSASTPQAWEAWAKPPAYTGKPTIYLNDSPEGEIALPIGSQIQLRFYGDSQPEIEQSLSETPPQMQGQSQITQLQIEQSGQLQIKGPKGRLWDIYAIPDFAPEISASADITREANGRFKQPYSASDDYAIAKAAVEISLDLANVPRHHGLTIEPEDIAPLTLNLPLPIRGKRDLVEAVFSEDVSQTIYANMPVSLVFTAQDGSAQEGRSDSYQLILPAKRFFDPMANAVAEMRRDILWNRQNAERSGDLLRAILHQPQDLPRAPSAAKRLRVVLREMDQALSQGQLSDERRDHIVNELWVIALKFEEGDLASALEKLQRAQDRLAEAIRNGADPSEIDQLMREMQQALRDYTRELAKNAPPADQQSGEQGQEITGDQLQQMLDEIERLMKEGKTAEAMALMEQLRQLLENMQVQQGEGSGEGEGQSGQGAMQELGQTLKNQQQLSDEAYRDLQRGRAGQEGQSDGQELGDRQRELSDQLNELQGGRLPGDGQEAGEAGREALDRAGEAMKRAEEALRDGNLAEALDNQAQAMQSMREGMQQFGRAQSQESAQNGQSQTPQEEGSGDPTGRSGEGGAKLGSDNNMVQNTPDSRAQSLLDEIRRRSSEAERPRLELDYLKRLLELF